MSDATIRNDEYVARLRDDTDSIRLARGSLLTIHEPLDIGGKEVARARLDWLDGSVIEVSSTTDEGNRMIAEMIAEWRESVLPKSREWFRPG